MDTLFRTHNYLVNHVEASVRRLLADEIDWSHRLIGIKGSRGVGKTTFLLQYAKEHFEPDSRKCLYVNFNNLFFACNTLIDFAREFYENGGRTLLLDQVFKYENWSKELRYCYDNFTDLQIIFTGSTVMRLGDENDDLKGIVAIYNLRGFSLREYINLKAGAELPHYPLNEILENHQQIALDISQKINPIDYFDEYLHHGFYPFFLETKNYSENLLKTINMMMEVDILLIKQIDLKYLSRIRKLLGLIMQCAPCTLNISQLSLEIGTSRSTVMNYLKYLHDARLLILLFNENEDFPKKPYAVYPHNTNLLNVIAYEIDDVNEKKTFICNNLYARQQINIGSRQNGFLVDSKYQIKLRSEEENTKTQKNTLYAVDKLISEKSEEVPIWLFGFLY